MTDPAAEVRRLTCPCRPLCSSFLEMISNPSRLISPPPSFCSKMVGISGQLLFSLLFRFPHPLSYASLSSLLDVKLSARVLLVSPLYYCCTVGCVFLCSFPTSSFFFAVLTLFVFLSSFYFASALGVVYNSVIGAHLYYCLDFFSP